ncbi:LOW QUALITY PROTEIN: CASP-like protein 4A3 [Mangifera indica]|uniref:LOW QUALITY PROTEIN: CASP-like protein 4A3 n=1 Tax=Mangifera indica TaxID=29780 RepID=UPI001CFAB73A|nr:LOW QUALITY PROTEIN: CASP-like protein 4A3 [Mangifera indica]
MKKSNSMKRSSSSHSDSRPHVESSHSPLRYGTPTFSDRGDPDPLDSPSSFQSASPDASPQKSPKYPDEKPNSNDSCRERQLNAVFPVVQKTVEPPQPPPSLLNLQKAVRENGPPPLTTVEPRAGVRFGAGRGFRTVEKLRVVNIGFRLIEVVLCLISFSVMAADKTKGWSGDSYDRYKEYRYCLSINVIAFVYAGFQAAYYLMIGSQVKHIHARCLFDFFMDQMLAYLLISSSSAAATRVDDWQSNWGKDEFTEMASASVAMSFLAFIAFAFSSVVSGYYLCNGDAK